MSQYQKEMNIFNNTELFFSVKLGMQNVSSAPFLRFSYRESDCNRRQKQQTASRTLLALPGKSYELYSGYIRRTFIHCLENYSNSVHACH